MSVRHTALWGFILLCSALAQPVSAAEEGVQSKRDRVYIRVGTYIVGHNNTDISITSPYMLGVNLSTTEDLNMKKPGQVARLDGTYRIKGPHFIGFSYYALNSEGQTRIGREIQLPDPDNPGGTITLPVGAAVDSFLNLDILKLNYTWSFFQSPKVALGLNAGLHITKIETGIKGELVVGEPQSVESVTVGVTAPLPVMGLRMSYNVTQKVRLMFEGNLFLVSVGDYSGSYNDSSIYAEYQFWRLGGIGGGLNVNRLDIKAKDSDSERRLDLDSEIAAAQLYFFFRF